MFVRTTGTSDSSFVQRKCIIGIDQSYQISGIAIAVNGELKKVSYVELHKIKTKTAKRKKLAEVVDKAICACLRHFKPHEIAIVTERIRTFTAGTDMRPDVIKAHAALVAVVVDKAWEYDIEVWSVDTRAWKSVILGTSKPIFEPIQGVKNPQKFGSVRYVIGLGFGDILNKNRGAANGRITYVDDAADAACIALYPFKALHPKLKKEL